MKVLIYGCGVNGKLALERLESKYGYEILAFIDRKAVGNWKGVDIIGLDRILDYDYDRIIISLVDYDIAGKIQDDLISRGVDKNKIFKLVYDSEFVEVFSDERSEFIKDCANWMNEEKMKGAVAECGVYRGDSSRFINRYFHNRKLYLFDTFQGFDKQDLKKEKELIGKGFNSEYFTEEIFENTSIDMIFSKFTYPENVIVKKGYFPNTAHDVDDCFCFVNLDMDLYIPMLEGLKYFYNRMVNNGIILLHDYFHKELQGVKAAVNEFERLEGIKLKKMPIGDHCSIAIIK